MGRETHACVDVAVPPGGKTAPARRLSGPRMKVGPETSRVPAGLVLPIPILPATSKIVELSMLHGVVNLDRELTAAVPSLVIDVQDVGVKNGRAPVAGTALRDALCELPDPRMAAESG